MNKVWEVEIIKEYIENHHLDLHKVFVDVGAGDGIHCSNSFDFIKNGWRALLIDGLKENIDTCRLLWYGLKHVDCICAVVSDKNEQVKFQEDERHWSLSTVSDSDEGIDCVTLKLSDILASFHFKEIGIISLDLEGMESKVLTDLISNEIHPQIIIVEGNTFEVMQEHRDILDEKYHFFAGVFPNQLFVLKTLIL